MKQATNIIIMALGRSGVGWDEFYERKPVSPAAE